MIASRDAILLALIQCGARGQLIEEAHGLASDACLAWGHALPKPASHYPHTATCERCGAAVELKPKQSPDPWEALDRGASAPPIRPLPEPAVRVVQQPPPPPPRRR